MSKKRGACDEESNRVIYENSYRCLGNNLRSEKELYKNAYFSLLRAFYPPPSSFHGLDCTVVKNTHVPVLSCILPINESTKIRMSVGSHNLMIQKKKFCYHRESVVEVDVHPTCCILFMHNRTVHGGGRSNSLNLRIFSIYGDKDSFACTENKNYIGKFVPCDEDCTECVIMKRAKEDRGTLFPNCEYNLKKAKLFEEIGDYSLYDHGFCVVKVANDVDRAVKNQALMLGNNEQSGVRFHSLGQEEFIASKEIGSRDSLDFGTHLDATTFIDKKFKCTYMNDFLKKCNDNICEYLSSKFKTAYELKGKTILRSKGIVGNQKLHVDGEPDCSCIQECVGVVNRKCFE